MSSDFSPGGARERVIDARREVLWTRVGILVTVFAVAMASIELVSILLSFIEAENWGLVAAHSLFIAIVAALIYGGLVYQTTRLFYYGRVSRHEPAAAAELEAVWDASAPSVTILVPSYMEEPETVTRTLLSAALQDYPNRRVVLLIDDPPIPSGSAETELLAESRRLAESVVQRLTPARDSAEHAVSAYRERSQNGSRIDPDAELRTLSAAFEAAAEWFLAQAGEFDTSRHEDRLLVERILLERAHDLAARSASCRDLIGTPATPRLRDRIEHEYRRLDSLFSVELCSFERKRYENLSHQPNKAMNLNAYIGLLGGDYRVRVKDGHEYLEGCEPSVAELSIPDSDYLLTLDADSVILPDYALRLISLAERPGNERLAVIQTPYSAFPGAGRALETIAGATTDIQYIIHQGFTAKNATYWVGANAVLRKSALLEIETTDHERGMEVPVFIQDRTVIEDTESTVDLIDRGWTLYNYPERLAFSATPPDFGALTIQRRRWANGGLLILPKLLRYLRRKRLVSGAVGEGLMRIHYLVSITAVNFGLVIILAVPFSESINTAWLPVSALPYFALYSRDLGLIGYRCIDVFRVYALNLLLIPVNIAGVLKSLQQAWTRRKIPFARTPKVDGRTVNCPICIVGVYLLLLNWFGQSIFDSYAGLWAHAAFAAVNASFLLYALWAFVGIRESLSDVQVALLARRAEARRRAIISARKQAAEARD